MVLLFVFTNLVDKVFILLNKHEEVISRYMLIKQEMKPAWISGSLVRGAVSVEVSR